MEMATHAQQVKKLYKTIMRLHRGLPKHLQQLGNNYAREEFKRHKDAGDVEVKIFMKEWSTYTLTLAEQLGIKGIRSGNQIGTSLIEADLTKFREEQLCQLYELMLAATGIEAPKSSSK